MFFSVVNLVQVRYLQSRNVKTASDIKQSHCAFLPPNFPTCDGNENDDESNEENQINLLQHIFIIV